MSSVVLSEADFSRFRDYFYQKSGIFFEDTKRYFVDKRILSRMKETGHESFRSYFTFVRFQASGEELQSLINLLTVNETYFFRETGQLDSLVEEVLSEVSKRRRGELIRIWSIPSSSGEEPYSIVLYLLEKWPDIANVDVEVIASDIDTKILNKAKQGIFSKRSVNKLPPHILKKYFKKLSDHQFQLSDDVRESVLFNRLNLSDARDMRTMKKVDIIFCRNLLIYFDDASRRAAAENFYDLLHPGGIIFLGHSESMSRISSLFKVRRFKKSTGYMKPLTEASK